MAPEPSQLEAIPKDQGGLTKDLGILSNTGLAIAFVAASSRKGLREAKYGPMIQRRSVKVDMS